MSRTRIANSHNLVRDGMLTICSASVDSMNVIDAATNGILLNDSDTHVEWFGDVESGRVLLLLFPL